MSHSVLWAQKNCHFSFPMILCVNIYLLFCLSVTFSCHMLQSIIISACLLTFISSKTIYPFSHMTITFTWSMLTSNSTLYLCLSFTIHVSCHYLSLSPSIFSPFLLVSRVTGSWTSLCSLRVHLPRSLWWSRLSSECLMDLVLHGEVNEQKHASHRTNRFTGLR